MSEVRTRSDFVVELIDVMGTDESVVQAARVSTLTDSKETEIAEKTGLISYLMKNRHGSPFEHGVMKFRIEAPIFVWREFMRHRVASYNEQSGRYTEMLPEFYITPPARPIVQTGKTGHYNFELGKTTQYWRLQELEQNEATRQWTTYREKLELGVAKEVAREHLGVNIYSRAYVTMNLRGLMNFLSLRVLSEDSLFPSKPMWEISEVAKLMEQHFRYNFYLTWDSFVKNQRVCP